MSRRSLIALASGLVVPAAALADDPKTKPGKSALTKAGPPNRPGPVEASFSRDYDPPGFKPSWKNDQINRTLVADFVIFAHSDLAMAKKLLAREPGLINAAMDWGGGDFETALGGASHMGRRDIVSFLLERGARIDLFCAAMLGQLAAVKAFLALEPKLIDAKGPHGFTLHFHAQVGGKEAESVLDYLQSLKKVELRPIPFLQKNAKAAKAVGKAEPGAKKNEPKP
jgi:hypothetical protein